MSAPILVITCHRDTLLPLVVKVAKVVDRNEHFPILSTLLIVADADGRVSVTATDLKVTAVATAENVDVTVAGRTCVDSELFRKSLAAMPAAPVTIEVSDEGALVLKSGRSRQRCHAVEATDFPDVVYRNSTHTFVVPAVDLTRMVEKVGFAISTEETRYYLNGIYLHAVGDNLVAVATDGHRLSKLKLPCPEGAEDMPGIIIPRQMTKHFTLLAGKDDAPIEIELSDRFIRFKTALLSITSQLIDGTFPVYDRFIPRDNPNVVTLPLADLSGAIARLDIHATGKDRTVAWEFSPETLAFTSKSQLGEAGDELEIACEFDMRIGFSAKYVLDMLASFRGPDVTLKLGDPSSPAMVLDLGDDHRELVLMPQRV